MPSTAKSTQVPHFDICISGGGVVGCLAALALAKFTDYKIRLLEASSQGMRLSTKNTKHAGFDARVIALGDESVTMLKALNIKIDTLAHADIQSIHVSDRGHIGQVSLHAKEQGVDALGKVISIDMLGEHLLQAIKHETSVDYKCPCKIEAITGQQDYQSLTLSDGNEISCKLLLISDGGMSATASLAGLNKQVSDYHQAAIITNIVTQLEHKNIAYERFTSQGPIAFLPMANTTGKSSNEGKTMSIVWCLDEALAAQKLALNQTEFLSELCALFGNKLGRLLDCSERFSYPLKLMTTEPFVGHRAICIGNAAQNLHPIAGQGFNLGIRDVFSLIQLLGSEKVKDLGAFSTINAYKGARVKDKQATIGMTNSLLSMFSNQHVPLVMGRNMALLTMNKASFLKNTFANFAMGRR